MFTYSKFTRNEHIETNRSRPLTSVQTENVSSQDINDLASTRPLVIENVTTSPVEEQQFNLSSQAELQHPSTILNTIPTTTTTTTTITTTTITTITTITTATTITTTTTATTNSNIVIRESIAIDEHRQENINHSIVDTSHKIESQQEQQTNDTSQGERTSNSRPQR